MKTNRQTEKRAGETAAPLTIKQAAKAIASAGICAERTARDNLYRKRIPLRYLQQMERGKIWIDPAGLQIWIETQKAKGGKVCK